MSDPDPCSPAPTPSFAPWSRTGLVLTASVVLAVLAALLPKPWGEGAVLDIRPDLSGLGRGGPLPDQPSGEPDEAVATVALPAAQRDSPGDDEQQRLQATLAAMSALADRLGPPAAELERPCVEKRDGVCTRRAMDRFFEQLYAVASGTADRPARWTQLGDSMTAWVDAPTRFRSLMQAQFGDAGIGMILPTDPGHARELQAVERSASGWQIRTAPFMSDARFGLSGSVFRGGRTQVITPVEVHRIGVMSWGSGSVLVRADGQAERLKLEPGLVQTRIDGATSISFEPQDPDDAIAGFVLEREGPGVLVDNLGVVSMRADQLLKVDETVWLAQARALDPDVMVFSYGAKSAHEPAWHREPPPEAWIAEYEASYSRVLQRGRQLPGDCLVLSLMTRAEPDGSGKRFTVFPSVAPTVAAQRRAALANGCAFYDSYTAMGGEEGPHDWYWHEPRLLGFDLLHLTPEGYHRYGTDLYVSVVHGFRDWLAERAVR